ncbi:MAG: pyrroline-5-carboxylate reductase [Pseudomonadota bacterium]
MSPERPLVLVGSGNMGGAMLEGWLAAGRDKAAIIIVDPAAKVTPHGVRLEPTPPDVTAHTVVMAVKPQMMADVMPAAAKMCDERTMILSVAAGIKVERLATMGGGPVVRTIPNTPASIGKGATAAFAYRAGAADRAFAEELLSAIGATQWVNDEALIDAATAVSGSGPAYVFHMVEAMTAAGEAEGLPPDVAAALARQTIVGAGALLERSELDPATLRSNVTSKGGTTAAALSVLMGEGRLTRLMTEAVAAAAHRSRELGS